ncbi:MAG: restriction endonuclease subunit S [Faecalibacterium sp.]
MVDKDYLFYFMPIALKRIEEKTPFVTVKHLSAKELNKIEIPVLPLEEQRKIAETLSKVDELIASSRAATC